MALPCSETMTRAHPCMTAQLLDKSREGRPRGPVRGGQWGYCSSCPRWWAHHRTNVEAPPRQGAPVQGRGSRGSSRPAPEHLASDLESLIGPQGRWSLASSVAAPRGARRRRCRLLRLCLLCSHGRQCI